ncbi:NAD(P)H-hydrate repair Nnr-like enzyme with NAD(P)H-hydrate dehydratase domain [Thermostichus sp. MS-CIW-21]|jgi:NAD(P)H-hydrate repair Nnr-like enzyme with NAD(P)H-hydrate dehydratase domain|uniref:chlororespiratory reduction protein 7 n=2 Tax=unclassified Synechococcus TaxID=2626047 RepID=UPI000C5C9CD9|nr:chlororespiratory reduction protein 7 [Synechococcus sp. 65AY640]PIK88425.1 hypothetical protein SYN65AY6A5_04800 [Synechococcus sp. 65AY6A5]PIK94216.1 hypothetical protein SYN60AY4M2_01535 [Synechococcus sp. 60AY4M2]PIK98799.1 hypothetical protein SYN63AY4M1_12480 [Synechococcus sp. 63AY4M1]PIL00466.1 hypothetical protein SYN65AY640_01525 [Synechococcus sp. 65AY640]
MREERQQPETMADPEPELLRAANHYVLLIPGLPEQFLTPEELQEFLVRLLQEHPHLVDADLARYPTPQAQAQRLIDTACEVEVSPGETVQWHPVRLRKRPSASSRPGQHPA